MKTQERVKTPTNAAPDRQNTAQPQPEHTQWKGPHLLVAERPHLLVAALIAAALTAFAVTLLIVRTGNDDQASLPPLGAPAAVPESQLKALASDTAHPVYWAGAKSGIYELTRTTDGRIYVRYLPSADKVGDREAKYLTVGTYPRADAFRNLQRAARLAGAVSVKIADGGLLVFNERTPKSVYFGYPDAKYQVEVYDPSPQQARTLVLGGRVKPIK